MYLLAPSREQATMVSDGESAPVPCRLAGLVQSSAANCALIAAFTPEDGVAVSVPVPPRADDSARTCLKRSSAVWPTRSTTRRPESPGTEITI